MEYETLARQSVRRFLPDHADTFRPAVEDHLAWHDETSGEVLEHDGTPLVRLVCHDRRWTWDVLGSQAGPMRCGSRAEARQLAMFYARRITA